MPCITGAEERKNQNIRKKNGGIGGLLLFTCRKWPTWVLIFIYQKLHGLMMRKSLQQVVRHLLFVVFSLSFFP